MRFRITIGYHDGKQWQPIEVIVEHDSSKGLRGEPEVTIEEVEEAEG